MLLARAARQMASPHGRACIVRSFGSWLSDEAIAKKTKMRKIAELAKVTRTNAASIRKEPGLGNRTHAPTHSPRSSPALIDTHPRARAPNPQERLGFSADDLHQYGQYKAKLDVQKVMALQQQEDRGKLILVTAMSPTKAGEGKTTTCVGLADGLAHIGKSVMVTLREPSLGPVFGVKGGAAGGGYAQIVPMDDINLHFTGDMHAISALERWW
jgi:hypothetical protein